ncbi:HYR domain-containing protein [Pseudoflavitalea sp. G-6-1-2]|uniref:T9SS-dependent choice-of-anchor J family protein n=1 Tax=Pseudoflavitalea sp. G-6-1-2 TaxID=2728841 RepID=UPI00146D627F|nr:choice-of-anchor J domain-containing protein [Pseudoflavitalea sp. G-6-1-2]NML22375.1 HYR domain-containing protein [Pseudoflavitalea sp. G-6-1-2]
MTLNSTRKFVLSFFLSVLFLFNRTQAQTISEGFDDVTQLIFSGWYMVNNSAPAGKNWAQGTPVAASGAFDAFAGSANAYIGVGKNSTGILGNISNWLLTPNRTFRNGDVITFYTRKRDGGSSRPDRLEVRFSTNGASTNTGTDAGSVGDFNTQLMAINASLDATSYPQNWKKYIITISGLAAPVSGRIGFRYFVTDGGLNGSNSDYIGIDEFQYTPYSCPLINISNLSMPTGKAGVAYSHSFSQTGSLGTPSYAITAGALPPGCTLSSDGTISGTPTATGTFNFAVTVSDKSGCFGTQYVVITVICPPNPITFNDYQICYEGSPIFLSATASPAGGSFYGTGVTGDQFDPSVGTQEIYYDITDPYGCAHSKSAVFTVVDPGITTVSPASQSVCGGYPITAIVPSNSTGGATFTWTRDKTTEVGGIPESGTGSISGTPVNTTGAPVTVTFTFTSNVNGCIKTATATLIVNPGLAMICPGNFSVDNSTNASYGRAYYTTAFAIGLPTPDVSYTFTGATTGSGSGTGSGSNFNIGVTTVTLKATNTCGSKTCSFTITVNDVQSPKITCPAPVTVSCAGEVPPVNTSSVVATDNYSNVTVSFVSDVISNKTCANRYTIARTYRATDQAGNASNCTQLITVNDQTAPVIACPANITTTTAGTCTAAVNFSVTATDNCGGPVTVVTSHETGTVFPLGTTTVTVTATDACGNQSQCSFTVTVTDTKQPAITVAPVEQRVCPKKDATFTVTASNALSYQWQKEEGSNWVNINGADQRSYTVSAVTSAVDRTRYRVAIGGACKSIYSEPVMLILKDAPAPTLSIPSEICMEEKFVQLAATPAGGTFTGGIIHNNVWNITEGNVGSHSILYTYTDADGCTGSAGKTVNLKICNTSNNVTKLFTYPNPTYSSVHLKTLIAKDATYTVTVTDTNGRTVWRKEMRMPIGWNYVYIDITAKPAGVYIISVKGNNGGKNDTKVVKLK